MKGFIGGCRYLQSVPSCRNVGLQRLVVKSKTVTMRLSDKKMPGLNLDDLTSDAGIIKGLFILPDLEKHPCLDGEPIIVFGKPAITVSRPEFRHVHLARELGLSRRRVLSASEQEVQGRSAGEEELEPGVWGFSISPVTFTLRTELSMTRVDFPLNEGQSCRMFVGEDTHLGLIDPETGEVDLAQVRDVKPSVAEMLWKRRVFAYLFRSQPKKDKQVWAVYASSGAAGAIPRDIIHIFLTTLARHAAPEFRVHEFNSFGGFYFVKRLRVSWQMAKFPSCLYWPREMRLVHGNPSENWWGD